MDSEMDSVDSSANSSLAVVQQDNYYEESPLHKDTTEIPIDSAKSVAEPEIEGNNQPKQPYTEPVSSQTPIESAESVAESDIEGNNQPKQQCTQPVSSQTPPESVVEPEIEGNNQPKQLCTQPVSSQTPPESVVEPEIEGNNQPKQLCTQPVSSQTPPESVVEPEIEGNNQPKQLCTQPVSSQTPPESVVEPEIEGNNQPKQLCTQPVSSQTPPESVVEPEIEGNNQPKQLCTQPVSSQTPPESVVKPEIEGINQPKQSYTDPVSSQTPVESAKSVPEPEVEGKNRPKQQYTEPESSVTDLPSKSTENEVKPVNATKTLLSDRIAFEEPIITDVENLEANPKSIFTDIAGPSFYHIKSNLVTRSIISKNIPAQFASLPVFGAPNSKDDLEQFFHNKIRDFVGDDLTDKEFEELANFCSPNHLKTGAELSMPVKLPTHGLLQSDSAEKLVIERSSAFDGDTKLCIHKKHRLRVDKDLGNHYSKKLKYRGIRLMPLALEPIDIEGAVIDGRAASAEPDKPDLEPGKDLLFRVRIYRPYDYNIKYFRGRSRHAVFCCDIIVPGRLPLSALRDRIVCANDVGMRVDVAAKPDDQSLSSAKEVFPSGFLFINNVFYVDTRAGCADHAAPLRAWAQRRGLGEFRSENMCVTKMEDVVLRLGFPEVYVHQGNCEHLFTFSEVRLLGPSDPLCLSQYPTHSSVASQQSVYCTTCAEFCAKWVVIGCSRVPFDPAFFCDTCFKLYLYKDGKMVGDFKAYCYKGNELNMLKPQG